MSFELSNSPHSTNDKEDEEEKCQVGEQAIDAQHKEDDDIVARKVSKVVINSGLDLAEVCRFGDALEVEELGDGPEVCKSRRQRLRSYARESVGQIETRRQNVNRNLNSRHFGRDLVRCNDRECKILVIDISLES